MRRRSDRCRGSSSSGGVGVCLDSTTVAGVQLLFFFVVLLLLLTQACLCADSSTGKVVATATLLLELKFIRNRGICGHIEDVVVDASCRGRNLGKRIVDALLQCAKQEGCYKVILDCSESNQAFYEKCGLRRKEIQMVRYL